MQSHEQQEVCPHCGGSLIDEPHDATCENCGAGVYLDEEDVHQASGAWSCPHCGHLNM